ncbi:MAG TPA: aquaporin [Acidimicrobiia bacterium]|jgi:aquaporin Z
MSRSARIFVAELIGTMILILGGPGTAIFAGKDVGFLGIAIAFGFSLLCAAYLFGHISGCHINPAVTIAMWALRRTPGREVPWYVVAQILGALIGGFILWCIVQAGDITTSKVGSQLLFSGASNGYGDNAPKGPSFYALGGVVIAEIVLTALFILVIVGTTRTSMIPGFAAIPIGLMLTLVHLISIPIDNTSVNPVRSLSTAVFANSWAIEQLWVFIVFPIIGGLVAAGIWRFVTTPEEG